MNEINSVPANVIGLHYHIKKGQPAKYINVYKLLHSLEIAVPLAENNYRENRFLYRAARASTVF